MKKICILFVLALSLSILAGCGKTPDTEQPESKRPPKPGQEKQVEKEKPLGGDKDEHGCIGSAGYTWCEAKQKCLREFEEPCEEKKEGKEKADKMEKEQMSLRDLVKEIQKNYMKENEIMLEMKEGEMQWMTKEGEEMRVMNMEAQTLSAEGVEMEKVETVIHYLADNDFSEDINNMADGTVASLVGYQKENLVCTIHSSVAGYKENEEDPNWEPADTNMMDLEVKCGEIKK